jgi:hypothetical protein
MGMGVEKWLYERLGRPKFEIVGEVATDLETPERVDWIHFESESITGATATAFSIAEMRLRGGCDLDALGHYLQLHARRVSTEGNATVGRHYVRKDHTSTLRLAWKLRSPGVAEALGRLRYPVSELASQFLIPAEPGTILIYSPWADNYHAKYTHKELDFSVPVDLGIHRDLTSLSENELAEAIADLGLEVDQVREVREIIDVLRHEYRYCDLSPIPAALADLRELVLRIPVGARLFVVLPFEWELEDGEALPRRSAKQYNHQVRALMRKASNVTVIEMNEVASRAELQLGLGHFNRIVYFRLFERLMSAISLRAPSPET